MRITYFYFPDPALHRVISLLAASGKLILYYFP